MSAAIASSSNTMDDVADLKRRFIECRDNMHRQLWIQGRFLTLMRLSSDVAPDFPLRILRFFLETSQRCFNDLTEQLEKTDFEVDFSIVKDRARTLMVGSASVGTRKLKTGTETFADTILVYWNADWRKWTNVLKNEFGFVRAGFEFLIEVGHKIIAAGGSIPTEDWEVIEEDTQPIRLYATKTH